MRYKIKNIPKYLDYATIKTTLTTKLNIDKKSIKLLHKPRQDYAIFLTTEPINIDTIEIGNNPCKIILSTIIETTLNSNIKTDTDADIRDLVTPLYKTAYNDQIVMKQKEIESFYKVKIEYYKTTNMYRNNCQFGVGFNINNEPVVGFRAKYNGQVPNLVYAIDGCINVSDNMKNIVKYIGDELRKKPELVYNRVNETGYISNVMIREAQSNAIVLLQIKDQGIIEENFRAGTLKDHYPVLAEFISTLKVNNLSLQFQYSKLNGFIPSEVYNVSGISILHEKIDGYMFEVSYFTFFQVNTDIANKICKVITEKGFKNTLLLDLCCGSGFFGIMLNKAFSKIIGIENNSECVKLAHLNIHNNNIHNYTIKLADVENEVFTEKCSVILDPPRAGVSKLTVQNLRANNGINEIFFICCAYKNSYKNIMDLCRVESKKYKNGAFVVRSVDAFDMFPNTEDSEILIHLTRN